MSVRNGKSNGVECMFEVEPKGFCGEALHTELEDCGVGKASVLPCWIEDAMDGNGLFEWTDLNRRSNGRRLAEILLDLNEARRRVAELYL